jgi:hypothetical protein
MTAMFMLVMLSSCLAFVLPILLGWFIGSNEGHGFAGMCVGCAVAFLLTWGTYAGGTSIVKGIAVKELAKEAGPGFYDEVASLRGRHCDVDLVIARAMRDRRLSFRDVLDIRAVDERHALADARAKLIGFRPTEACRTVRTPA